MDGVVFNHYGLLAKELHAAVSAAIVETATEIEKDVKGDAPTSYAGAPTDGGPLAAPFLTGNLRRSYHQDRSNLADPLEPTVDVGNDPGIAPYGIYLEYGTSRMAPRPHLTPSSEAQRGPHQMRLAAAIAEAAGRGGIGAFAAPAATVSGADAGSGGMSFGLPNY